MKRKDILIRSLTLFMAGATFLAADEGLEELETRHTEAMATFEAETRAELTRIARDKSLGGEQKIIVTEKWFATHTGRIAAINSMADDLDERKPLVGSQKPPRPVDNTQQGKAATDLHALNLRFSKGEMTTGEFETRKEALILQLSALHPPHFQNRKRLPVPSINKSLTAESSGDEIANALHAQNRFLASLPEHEAQAIRADKTAAINILFRILEQKEFQSEQQRTLPESNQRNQR